MSQADDALTAFVWLSCRHVVRSKDLMLASCGRIATAVGMGPMKGMSREMVFVKSGLKLGLISPVNDPIRRVEQGEPLLEPSDHGMGDQAASDAMTASLR